MAELIAIDCVPGPTFVAELERAWEAGDAVLPLQREAPLAMRRRAAEAMGASRVVTETGSESLHNGRVIDREVALVVLTSGSTGEPKGAMLDHSAVEYSAFAGATALSVAGDTHWLACLPLSHVGGLSVLTRAIHTGAALTVAPRFSPEALDDALSRGATHISLVPTTLRRIDPTPWRRILLGGSRMPTPLPANCVASYGMTETMGGVVYDGIALNGVGMRIAGIPTGQSGVAGPVELRTPTLMRGYRAPWSPETGLSDPPADGIDAQGWFATGDVGRIRVDDGRLEVFGRADDLIVTGAENVWPAPVEQRILEHHAVAEVAVFGTPDPEWGEVVTAVIVTADGVAPPVLEDLRDWVAEVLPRAAAPKRLHHTAGLPRTALGKVRRAELPGLVDP
ncbi:MAG: ANL family adenylate-forming protein [Microthrixaceae bacterium]